jgi:predicted nucleic acid-binding protein
VVEVTWAGGPWVVDTSAWARASQDAVAEPWKEAARAGELIGCPIVSLELLYDAPDRQAVERIANAVGGLRQAPITRAVCDAAIWAVRELAAREAAGGHRVLIPDTLIAAAAAERGFGVLHYDRHFDRLAAVLPFTSQWVAPAGSLP